MEKLQMDQKFRGVLRVLQKCSHDFFQLEGNQKHIYHLLMAGMIKDLNMEIRNFAPFLNLHICHLLMVGVIKDLNMEISDETFKFKSL